MQDSLVRSSLLLAPLAGFAVFPVIRMLTFLEELLLSQLVGVVYPESAFTGLKTLIKVKRLLGLLVSWFLLVQGAGLHQRHVGRGD